MADFGGYELVREIHRSGLGAVSTARLTESREPATFVIRTYQPFTPISSKEQAQLELESFLDAARTQERIAETGAPNWAKIHACGSDENGAFYVTDHYERSAQNLILGQVKLSGTALRAIVESVVKGLIQIRQVSSRPHGNLKPSNVLISGTGSIESSSVVLADPLAPGQIAPEQDETIDFHPLGELIYQLVFHRSFPALGWPVPPSEEWSRLGKKAEEWRNFCNRLLTPDQAPGWLTLEEIGAELVKLREVGGGVPINKIIMAGGAAVVLGMAIVLVMGMFGSKFEPLKWEELCDWWGCVIGNSELRAMWREDEHLNSAALAPLREAESAGIEMDPRRIGGAPGEKIRDLKNFPPKGARRGKAVEKTKQALAVVDKVAAAIKAIPAQWPLLADRRKLKAQVGPRLKKYLGLLTKQKHFVRPCEAMVAVESVFKDKKAVDAILAPLGEIEAGIASVGEESFERKLMECVRAETTKAWTLKSLLTTVVAVKEREVFTSSVGFLKEARDAAAGIDDKELGATLMGCMANELRDARDFRSLQAKLANVKQELAALPTGWDDVEKISVGGLGDELKGKFLTRLKTRTYETTDLAGLAHIKAISSRWRKIGAYCAKIDEEDELAKCRDLVQSALAAARDLESLRKELEDAWDKTEPMPKELTDKIELAADRGIVRIIKKHTKAELNKDNVPDLELLGRIALEWKGILKYGDGMGEPLATEFKRLVRKEAEGTNDLNSLQERASSTKEFAAEIATSSGEIQKLAAGEDISEMLRGKLGECFEVEIDNTTDLYSLMARVKNARRSTAAITDLWERVRAGGKGIDEAKAGSKLLAEFPEFVKAEVDKAKDLAELSAALRDADGVATRLVTFVKGDWQSDEKFAREHFVAVEKAPEEAPTKKSYETWLAATKGYYRMQDDPREGWAQGKNSIAEMVKEYRGLPDHDPALLKDFESRLAYITGALKPVPDPEKTPGIEKNRELIWGDRKDLADRISSLRKEVEKVTVPPPELVKKFKEEAESGKDVPDIYRENVWPKVCRLALRELNADKIRYWQLEKKALPDLRRQLADLGKGFAQPDTVKLKEYAQRERVRALREVAGAVPWTKKFRGLRESYPDFESEDSVAARDEAAKQFNQWLDTLRGLIDDFAAIGERINGSWGEKNLLDHKPEAQAGSIRELYTRAGNSPIFKVEEVSQVFAPTVGRVTRLLKIEKLTDKKELLAFTESDQLDVVAAAWWRLGQIEKWPSGLEELAQEADIREKLKDAKFPAAHLAAEGPPRWDKCIRSLSQCDRIETAVKLRADFGVSLENVGPSAQYNILLWELLQKLQEFRGEVAKVEGPKEQGAVLDTYRPEIDKSEKAIAELTDIANKEPVKLFLLNLAELKKGPGKVVDLSEIGPGAASWGQHAESSREHLKYNWPKNNPAYKLEFVRIEPKDPAVAPFYLCTTEVSAEMFIEFANLQEEIRKLLWQPAWRGQTRKGVRIWKWRRKQVVVTQRWLNAPPIWEKRTDVDPGAGSTPPTSKKPIQYVSPGAAKAFCEAIGSRLPTPGEWRAAIETMADAGETWNVRDAKWRVYQKHIEQVRKEFIDKPPYPDEGIFGPAAPPTKISKGGQAKPVSQENDGELWFGNVYSGRASIRHLVGNVAEYVHDEERFFVVGGSAMSPPEMWDGAARPYYTPYEVPKGAGNAGWSDVGFRPAFRAGGKSVATLLELLLAQKKDYCLAARKD